MGYIKEEIANKELPMTIVVVEGEEGEDRLPDAIISLYWDDFGIGGRLNSEQLIELGKWLIVQGNRIGKSYDKNGTPILSINTES